MIQTQNYYISAALFTLSIITTLKNIQPTYINPQYKQSEETENAIQICEKQKLPALCT